jgi:hypothetical protein
MTFSLINVYSTDGDYVFGTWIQDFVGSKRLALIQAKKTEDHNGGKITVAVTEKVPFGPADGPCRAKKV